MSLTSVADTDVATVVTTLAMTRRPAARPLPPGPLRLVRWRTPAITAYRTLFARVGTPWLWYSRLAMDDARLAAILADRQVAVHAVIDPAGIEVGMLELDHSLTGTCRIAYFGFIPELAGRGHGRWLMAHALTLGWRPDTQRMLVHTCTLDHPRALGFYRAQGFRAIARTLETFPDPRVSGLLPADAAPQVPLLSAVTLR
ncbi:GNAT family N-acetyltransferase [Sphingomonas montana]|uniref:GNAT family N-acetyltransferase n=1 Tax=Sphingomonas montana TaxID=1843236 RepID=UPI00096F2AF6|nr:GNAT family N-acetyltransferase [Sphingomonas montana]